jgi:hypothetical protein
MQIHGLLEFPVNDSTFVGGTTMQIHGLLKPMQMIPHSLLKPVTGIIAPHLQMSAVQLIIPLKMIIQ